MTSQERLNEFWRAVNTGESLAVISGPCVIETASKTRDIAAKLIEECNQLEIPLVFKASFDKANRTSGASYRGPGFEEGLEILQSIRADFGVPVTSDVHTEDQAIRASNILDVIQIPAFLCRQTDLIEAGAAHAPILNIKKGQFLSPWEVAPLIQKAQIAGAKRLLITERGFSFGYNNLVADMRAPQIIQGFGVPLIFDATHSVQSPGGGGDRSTGFREYAPTLARSAVAAGARGVFFETHPNPDESPSDGPNMIPLVEAPALLATLKAIHKIVHQGA